MQLTIDTSSGSNGITTGQMQGSCQDLRFTNTQGKLLPYYIDSGCATSSTYIWLLVDLVPKNTTTMVLYMYYGNPTAAAGSDANTFRLYNNLEGYWNMNEASAASCASGKDNCDLSVNSADGTWTGATSSTTAKYVRSLDVSADSTERMQTGARNWGFSTSGTVSAWIKTSSSAAQTVFSLAPAGTANDEFLVYIGTTLQIYEHKSSGNYWQRASSSTVNTGNWVHVVVTMDGTGESALRVYVNGVQETGTSITAGSPSAISDSSTRVASIGWRNNDNASEDFIGYIDDVRVWGRTLSPDEVEQVYNDSSAITANLSTVIKPSTISYPTAANAEKASSPVAYWKLDDGTGTTSQDSGQNNLDLTLAASTATPTWQTEDLCITGKCLLFDGSNDYASKTDDDKLDFAAADNFTISAWVKHSGAIATNPDYILTKASGATYTGYKLYMSSTGQLCFDTRDGTNAADSACSGTGFDDNKWHFVVGVKEGTSAVRIYVDGALKASDASIASTGSLANSGTIYLGVDADGTSNSWAGFIDDVKIYRDNSIRSAAQVQAAYNSRSNNEGANVLGAYNQKALSDGLVGYWKMDQSSWNGTAGEVIDSSGNGFNGTAVSTATTTSTNAKFANSGTFNGTSDYVTIADNAVLRVTKFTLSAWVRPAATLKTGEVIGKRSLCADTHEDFPYALDVVSDGSVTLVRSNGGDYTDDGTSSATGIVTAGSWYHLVATYDGQYNRIYVNGTQVASSYDGGTTATNTQPVAIGRQAALGSGCQPDFYYKGLIDEARIYNRALSGNEVSQLYNFAPGPVGYWKLDENTGTNAYDSSGNGYTGTLNNSPSWTSGKFGQALNFVQGSSTNVDMGDNLDFAGDFSISTWVKSTGGSSARTIVGKQGTAGNHEYTLRVDNGGDNELHFIIFNTANADYLDADSGTNIVSDGLWHHVAAVLSGSVAYIYVDGILKGSDNTTSGGTRTTNSSDPLRIGATNSGQYFEGPIDEVKMYNYARTQKQIIEDMNGGHPAVGTPVGSTVAHWRFDEGYGTTANDSSSQNGSENLTLSTTSWTQAGKFGRAFDGGDNKRLSRTTDSDLEFSDTDDFSLSLWYKSDSATNPAARQYLLSDGPGTAAGYAVWANTDGTICFGVDDDATADPPEVASCTSTDLYDATWHYIAGVRDHNINDKTYLYIDGKLIDSDSDTTTATLDSSPTFYLGDENGTDGTDEFLGDLDEVKIYRTALVLSDILNDYNRGSSQVMGALSDKSTYEKQAANQEYCVPGDSSSCAPPVGRWDFEEGTGTTINDSSGNGNTGTYSGTTGSQWVNDHGSKALSFNGTNNYVNIGSNTVGNGTAYTMEAWFKTNDLTTLPNIYAEASTVGGNESSNIQIYVSSDGTLDAYIRDNASVIGTIDTTSPTTNGDNKWHHVALVQSSKSSRTLYLDGKSIGTSATTVGTFDFNNARIGVMERTIALGFAQYYKGQIDQVMRFDYARSAAQVAWDYNRGAPAALYRMDECQGTIINDSSGNLNTGTLTIGTGAGTGHQDSAGTCTTNASTLWYNGATGKYNASLNFDGIDDYATVPFSSSYQQSTVTVSAWVKTPTINSSYMIAATENAASNTGWRLAYADSGSGYRIQVCMYTAGTQECQYGTTNITANQWSHFVFTYDGTNTKIYKDGKLETTVAMTAYTVGSGSLYIGNHAPNSFYFNGQIDDVRVYNYPLTATQVRDLYTSGAVRFGPVTGSP
jgi:hypothetical protein